MSSVKNVSGVHAVRSAFDSNSSDSKTLITTLLPESADPNTSDTPAQTTISESPSSDPLTGSGVVRMIGKYRISAVLGSGGMGVVYSGFDPLIERQVAIKVLSAEIAESPVALQRFLTEARSIGRVSHPHVVSVFDVGTWHNTFFMVMEFLPGGSVLDLAERRGRLSWKEACRITLEAARGLAAAHAAGLIHRDVKPANLMLTADGTVKVVDFGLSKVLDPGGSIADGVTRTGQLLGTPHYMSPEQFEGVSVTAATDTYALGATLFRLLTNRFPFEECVTIGQLMKALLVQDVPKASDSAAGIPRECDRIVRKAMARNPEDRFASCSAMADELQQLLLRPDDSMVQKPPQTPSEPQISKDFRTRQLNRRDVDTSRWLSSVVIAESSELQSEIRKDLLLASGVGNVRCVRTLHEIDSVLRESPPDLLWTAMELADGRALDWMVTSTASALLKNVPVVLNSTDCSAQQLSGAESRTTFILAPKAARLEAVLRVIHGVSSLRIPQLAADSNPRTAGRIRIISDNGVVPDSLQCALEALNATNLEIVSPARMNLDRSQTPQLTLLIRHVPLRSGDDSMYTAMVFQKRQEMAVAIQDQSDSLMVRAVSFSGILARVRRPLDQSTLQSLLQASR